MRLPVPRQPCEAHRLAAARRIAGSIREVWVPGIASAPTPGRADLLMVESDPQSKILHRHRQIFRVA